MQGNELGERLHEHLTGLLEDVTSKLVFSAILASGIMIAVRSDSLGGWEEMWAANVTQLIAPRHRMACSKEHDILKIQVRRCIPLAGHLWATETISAVEHEIRKLSLHGIAMFFRRHPVHYLVELPRGLLDKFFRGTLLQFLANYTLASSPRHDEMNDPNNLQLLQCILG